MGKKALKNPAKGYLLGELGDTMMRPLFGNVWYVGGGFRNELEPEPKPKPKPKHRLGVRNWVSLSDSLRSGGDSSKPSGSSASSTCSDGTLRLSSGLFSFSFSMVASIFFALSRIFFANKTSHRWRLFLLSVKPDFDIRGRYELNEIIEGDVSSYRLRFPCFGKRVNFDVICTSAFLQHTKIAFSEMSCFWSTGTKSDIGLKKSTRLWFKKPPSSSSSNGNGTFKRKMKRERKKQKERRKFLISGWRKKLSCFCF